MNETTKQAYLSFRLNKELFAVSAFKVLEVLEIQNITQIPNTPPYILGVINFRGDVLPVIDSRSKFGMPEGTITKKTVIIVLDLIVNNEPMRLGATADGVKDVIEIDEREMKEVPKMGISYNTEFIKGMIYKDNGFIMVLDVDKVFSTEDVNLIENAMS